LLLQLEKLSFDISVIQKLANMEAICYSIKDFSLDYLFYLLIIYGLVLFELNFYCMLVSILGGLLLITVIIRRRPWILESKAINEEIKTVINLGIAALTGVASANASNGRDGEERPRQEEEERTKEEEQRQKEEDAKNTKKVDDKSIQINYKSSYILGWLLSNVNIEITDTSSQFLQFSYGVFLGSILTLFCLLNIVGYILTNYLFSKVDFEKRFPNYPKIGKCINRIRNISLFYICIDILICLYLLSIMIFYSLVIVAQLQSSG